MHLLSAASAGAQKTDVVELTNGDRLTGEIERLERGVLRLSTDALDTVRIEWQWIAAIHTDKTLDVGLANGTRLFGSLAGAGPPAPAASEAGPADPPGSVPEAATVEASGAAPGAAPGAEVSGGSGEPILHVVADGIRTPVERGRIVEIVPIQRGFAERLDGSLSVGLNTRSAGDATDFHLDFQASYRTRRNLTGVSLSSTRSTQDGAEDINRQLGVLRFERYLTQSNRWFALARVERNDELDLQLRSSLGLGFARSWFQSSRSSLSWLAGAMANREDYVGEPGQNTVEALLALDFQVFRFEAPQRADLSLYVALLPSLSDWSRLRTETQATGRYELFKDLFFVLDLWHSYDSAPPVAERTRTDYGITSSLSFSF